MLFNSLMSGGRYFWYGYVAEKVVGVDGIFWLNQKVSYGTFGTGFLS